MNRGRPTHYLLLILLTLCGCGKLDHDRQTIAQCLAPEDVGSRIEIMGGTFMLGVDPMYSEEGPPTQVTVDTFFIDAHEVTNTQFAEFVAATGYVTTAERPPPNTEQLPPEMREPGSAVFVQPDRQNRRWWRWVSGANWGSPAGPGSNLDEREFHPVVHVTHEDALAYARWRGGRLPSEAEWEFAARAGNPRSVPPTNSDGLIEANHYQGVFPARDTGEDGFVSTSPVGCFEANAFGLHDMIGNVWEWTDDGSDQSGSTIKGGSYLCADNYCRRYRPTALQVQERDLGTSHVGFRVAYDGR